MSQEETKKQTLNPEMLLFANSAKLAASLHAIAHDALRRLAHGSFCHPNDLRDIFEKGVEEIRALNNKRILRNTQSLEEIIKRYLERENLRKQV